MTREQASETAVTTWDLDYQIGVMQAFKAGRQIENRIRYGNLWFIDDDPTWNWADVEYRIKPTAKLRPWTADEVPTLAWIRPKEGGWRSLILAVQPDGTIVVHYRSITREVAFQKYEHSLDGKTWLPCGVVEEVK